jgi:hypothetical protein
MKPVRKRPAKVDSVGAVAVAIAVAAVVAADAGKE